MALSIGKPVIVRNKDQIKRIRQSVVNGKKLDTSDFNYTPKKSVAELLNLTK
jgi:hypothetical protein